MELSSDPKQHRFPYNTLASEHRMINQQEEGLKAPPEWSVTTLLIPSATKKNLMQLLPGKDHETVQLWVTQKYGDCS